MCAASAPEGVPPTRIDGRESVPHTICLTQNQNWSGRTPERCYDRVLIPVATGLGEAAIRCCAPLSGQLSNVIDND